MFFAAEREQRQSPSQVAKQRASLQVDERGDIFFENHGAARKTRKSLEAAYPEFSTITKEEILRLAHDEEHVAEFKDS